MSRIWRSLRCVKGTPIKLLRASESVSGKVWGVCAPPRFYSVYAHIRSFSRCAIIIRNLWVRMLFLSMNRIISRYFRSLYLNLNLNILLILPVLKVRTLAVSFGQPTPSRAHRDPRQTRSPPHPHPLRPAAELYLHLVLLAPLASAPVLALVWALAPP